MCVRVSEFAFVKVCESELEKVYEVCGREWVEMSECVNVSASESERRCVCVDGQNIGFRLP